MAWVRWGDTSSTYPALMNVALFAPGDDCAVTLADGFIHRCAQYSAEHWTDYVVPLAAALQFCGSRTEEVIGWCESTGLLERVADERGFPALKLVEDDDFFHIITKAEREAEAGKNADLRDDWLKAQVVFRDGDQCRWCGRPVKWEGNPGRHGRKGTLDHLHPGEFGNPDTIVVCCKSCNSARQDREDEWASEHNLMRIPPTPLYSKFSIRLFERKAGLDWKEHLAKVAGSRQSFDASVGRSSSVDPGEGSSLASVDSGLRTPALSDSSVVQEVQGECASVGRSSSVDPGEGSSLASVDSGLRTPAPDPKPSGTETTAVSKPVLPGRVGTGSGPVQAGQGRVPGPVGSRSSPPRSTKRKGRRKR